MLLIKCALVHFSQGLLTFVSKIVKWKRYHFGYRFHRARTWYSAHPPHSRRTALYRGNSLGKSPERRARRCPYEKSLSVPISQVRICACVCEKSRELAILLMRAGYRVHQIRPKLTITMVRSSDVWAVWGSVATPPRSSSILQDLLSAPPPSSHPCIPRVLDAK